MEKECLTIKPKFVVWLGRSAGLAPSAAICNSLPIKLPKGSSSFLKLEIFLFLCAPDEATQNLSPIGTIDLNEYRLMRPDTAISTKDPKDVFELRENPAKCHWRESQCVR